MARRRVRKLRAADLCSGPGGVTQGYKDAGLDVVAAVDTDARSRDTYAANHPEVKLYGDDLLKLDPKTLLERLGIEQGQLDVLTACVPCQTFSTLGPKKKRARDPRNRLVQRVARFVEAIKPRALVMENVPPLVTDVRFTRLVSQLRRLDYGVRFDIVDAAQFGVPQRRRRLVLIALRGRSDDQVPALTPDHPALAGKVARRTVRDTFTLLSDSASEDPLAKPRTNYPLLVAQRIAAVPLDGGSRNSLPPELVLTCHSDLEHSAAANVYGRMKLDDVAPTLTTRCTTPACGRFLHPIEDRAITLREAACLQTFPVGYEFKGGSISIQAQIGNAVPPKLAEAIALVVVDALKKIPAAPRASSPATRTRMQRVGKRDTPAELALRAELHRRGLRFRVDKPPLRDLRRRADIVFRPAKVAVFVDGCFWHGCPQHVTWPEANGEWWKRKIEGNRRRDADTNRRLHQAGWHVIRAWEHEDVREVAHRVALAIVRRRPVSP